MTPARALASLVFGVLTSYAAPTAVTSVRVWSQPEVTRIIIEFDGQFEYKHERLSNPGRIYFDISNSALKLSSAPGKRHSTTQVGDSLVQRVRIAESSAGSTRLVFDLASEKIDYFLSELANPSRLVVEFRAGTGASPRSVVPPKPAVAPKPAPSVPRITIDQMRDEAQKAVATGKIPASPAAVPVTEAVAPTPAEAPKPSRTNQTTARDIETALPANRGSKSMTRALGLKLGKIVIDPGHGGHDFGTSSRSGLHEKELVLDIAKRLGALLEDQLGSEVAYTRTDDTYIPLEKRTEFANAQRADLFISIHANSSPYPRVAGPETFFLNFTSSKEAMDVAARENASSGKTIFELQDLVKRIALNEKLTESREFAEKIQSSMANLSRSKARNRGVKRAPFVVLIGANMPSVLSEIGFVTNSREEALLKKPDYRQKVAEALFRGISQYASSLSRFQLATRNEDGGSGTDSR